MDGGGGGGIEVAKEEVGAEEIGIGADGAVAKRREEDGTGGGGKRESFFVSNTSTFFKLSEHLGKANCSSVSFPLESLTALITGTKGGLPNPATEADGCPTLHGVDLHFCIALSMLCCRLDTCGIKGLQGGCAPVLRRDPL